MRGARYALLAVTLASTALLATPAVEAGAAQASAGARQTWAAAASVAAPEVVLINQPVRTVCSGHKFTVGVWYQRTSGGSRAYRVSVSGPRHKRFFYRAGKAPTAHWRFWKVLAGRAGRYRTVYAGHKPGSTKWTRYVAITRAHRCHGG